MGRSIKRKKTNVRLLIKTNLNVRSIKLKLKAKDREIYDLRQKSTNYEMIIADLKNQIILFSQSDWKFVII